MKNPGCPEKAPRSRGGERVADAANIAGVVAGVILNRRKTQHPIKSVEAEPKVEPTTKPRSSRLLKTAAALVVASLLSAGANLYHEHMNNKIEALSERADDAEARRDRSTRALAGMTGVKAETIDGTNLRDVSELPGNGKKVTPEQREALGRATVSIARREKEEKGPWERRGMGVMVKDTDGTPVVSTATHLFSDERDWIMGNWGPNPVAEAANIADGSPYEYGLFDPRMDTYVTPFAVATDIAIDTTGITDTALMGFDNIPSRAFRNHATFSLASIETKASDSDPFLPGEEVTLFSNSYVTGDKILNRTGTYLGSMAVDPGAVSDAVHLVGLQVGESQQDACYYGTSGVSGLAASGNLTGPLSWRSTTGYGPDHRSFDEDTPQGEKLRLETEDVLGIDLSEFDVLCGFSLAEDSDTMDTYDNLHMVLADAVTSPIPKLAPASNRYASGSLLQYS